MGMMLFAGVVLLLFAGSVAFASADGEHGSAEPKGWVKEDTYRVMNFAVLAIALFFILRKPMSQALGARIEGIKDQLSKLEARKKEAEQELAKYNEKLSLMGQEAEKIVEEYVRQGNEAKVRILKEAESAAVKLEDQARRNIAHEFERAKLQLQEEILEKALVKAEGIVKRNITDEDQDRLVDEYLEKVVA
jgi:F-type H+-transporting ATPase subunit b